MCLPERILILSGSPVRHNLTLVPPISMTSVFIGGKPADRPRGTLQRRNHRPRREYSVDECDQHASTHGSNAMRIVGPAKPLVRVSRKGASNPGSVRSTCECRADRL